MNKKTALKSVEQEAVGVSSIPRSAKLVRVDEESVCWVEWEGGGAPRAARIASSLSGENFEALAEAGAEVLITSDALGAPVIWSLIVSTAPQRTTGGELVTKVGADGELLVDGQRVLLQARDSVELRCGKASITLTRAGKVIIRGAYVSTRSTGVNRIRGGSVEIN